MSKEEAIKMLKAKLECMTRDVSGRDSDCINRRCDECHLNYEQGNMGEQKEWLRMAIKALEQQPSEDCISRKFMYDMGATCIAARNKDGDLVALGALDILPSATPQPKTGHWTHDGGYWENRWICSECGYKLYDEQSKYCPECGSYNGGKRMNELTKIKQRILERIETYIGDIEFAEEQELTEDEKTIFKSVKNIINEEFQQPIPLPRFIIHADGEMEQVKALNENLKDEEVKKFEKFVADYKGLPAEDKERICQDAIRTTDAIIRLSQTCGVSYNVAKDIVMEIMETLKKPPHPTTEHIIKSTIKEYIDKEYDDVTELLLALNKGLCERIRKGE